MPTQVIKSWYDESILYEREADSIKEAVERAVAIGANLVGANLVGASLVRANLDGANLVGANLVRANLDCANLDGARLVGANLDDKTIMPCGETFGAYKSDVLPALLTAGGKTVEQVVAAGAWDCHDWTNCPMHCAFGIDSESKAPTLFRPRIREFVQLFDANLLPCPVVETANAPLTE